MVRSLADCPLAELVRERVDRARVLERYSLDYCCGGSQTLREACARAAIPIEPVVEALAQSDAAPAADETDWSTAALSDLADHIVARHHVYLRDELPRLEGLLEKVVAAHGAHHPELRQVQQVYAALAAELRSHMMKEEQVLFPIVKRLEEAAAGGHAAPAFHCGSVNNPIAVMEDEHRFAGDCLRRMSTLTGQYEVPADACQSYRVLLAGLDALEQDLHLHIHKENNVLFPRASQLEASLAQAAR